MFSGSGSSSSCFLLWTLACLYNWCLVRCCFVLTDGMDAVIDLTTPEGDEVIDLTHGVDCVQSVDSRTNEVVVVNKGITPVTPRSRQSSEVSFCKCPVCFELYDDLLAAEVILMAFPCGHVLCSNCIRRLAAPRNAAAGLQGEPMEETAVREVSEEVGVEIHKVEYIGMSQPWPFPQNSLMFAFFGQVANDNARLNVENSGLKAKWFSKDEVKKAFKNSARPIYATNGNEELRLPPPGVIAHDMIHKWLVS
uniref:NAD(+) diphosphatase n=1 Tax=Trichuris muris TaxID=70415 RepID=A0A5S6QZE7_TRIMR